MIDLVHSQREKHVRGLLEPVQKTIDSLLNAQNVSAGVCKVSSPARRTASSSEQLVCEARILGQLLQHLHSHNLWPLPDPSQVTTSALLLASVVQDLAAPENNMSNNTRHPACRPSFVNREQIGGLGFDKDAAISTLSFAYTAEWHKVEHMNDQADLTGVINPRITELHGLALRLEKAGDFLRRRCAAHANAAQP